MSGLSMWQDLERPTGRFGEGKMDAIGGQPIALFPVDFPVTKETLNKLNELCRRIHGCVKVIHMGGRQIGLKISSKLTLQQRYKAALAFRNTVNENSAFRSATPTQPAAQRTPRKTSTSTTSTTPATPVKDEVASAQAVSFSHPKPGPRK